MVVDGDRLDVVTKHWLDASFEDHGLGLEERQQAFLAAFAADARLLEPAERHAEVGAEGVVADGAGAQLAGDLRGPGRRRS